MKQPRNNAPLIAWTILVLLLLWGAYELRSLKQAVNGHVPWEKRTETTSNK